nr:hypothetical protein [Pseudomonas sp. ML96]
MTLSDATLALMLSARIHGTDSAVVATAKRCAQRLPRSKRRSMFSLINSPEPLKLVAYVTEHLDLD